LSLTVQPGERVALVGPNGAGKSTFMLHLNGILTGEGEVDISGVRLQPASLPSIRARVGVVFQNPDDQLFSPTVFEDVAFGPLHMGLPEAEVRQRTEAALGRVGLPGFGDRLSHHLSVGEKKRVALATVLTMAPDLLVLDEPSAGLDPRGRREIIRLLQEVSLTLIVSTHDLALVRELLTRTVLLDQGRIVFDGPTEELLANHELLLEHGLEPV
jgi:energy-coupling factor transporter ATP-binding protein EcfA2